MRVVLATALLSFVLLACNVSRPAPEVEVEEAWVQLPPVPGRPGAAYFTLKSNNDPTKLVSVTSPLVERVELHETRMEDGVSMMRPAGNLVFPDTLELKFAPGEKHAMLFGLDPALKPGATVPLTFTFHPAPPVTVEAEVRSFGEGHAAH